VFGRGEPKDPALAAAGTRLSIKDPAASRLNMCVYKESRGSIAGMRLIGFSGSTQLLLLLLLLLLAAAALAAHHRGMAGRSRCTFDRDERKGETMMG
jgi:hypothetical protein